MIAIKLYTRDGAEVTTVRIPPFLIPAEGILWGERTFFLDREVQQYREGLLFVITETGGARPVEAGGPC